MDSKREDKMTPVSNPEELLPEEMAPDLKKFIVGAATIGFLPPLDLTATLYKDSKKNAALTIGPQLPVGAAYSPYRNTIHMNIPNIDWEMVGSDATNIKGDNARQSVIIFCHELLHALHHNCDNQGYSKMSLQKDQQYSLTEERYAIAGFEALLPTQHKPKRDTQAQKIISDFNEHLMCEKLGFMPRLNAKDPLEYPPISKQAQNKFDKGDEETISKLLQSYGDEKTKNAIDKQVGQLYGKALANGETISIDEVLEWIKSDNTPADPELESSDTAPPPPPFSNKVQNFSTPNSVANLAGQHVTDASLPSETTIESQSKLTDIVKKDRTLSWAINKYLNNITTQETRDKIDLELGMKYGREIKEGTIKLPEIEAKINELAVKYAPAAPSAPTLSDVNAEDDKESPPPTSYTNS